MKNVWFVSRQSYWGVDPEDQNVVEIALGGRDYSNPDMLVPKYSGEGQEYTDPREALKVAVEIAKAWKKDAPHLKIKIAHGCTGGNTMPFEGSPLKELKAWAQKTYESLPKCAQCGEILGKETYTLNEDPDAGSFCSEYCAEEAVALLQGEEDA